MPIIECFDESETHSHSSSFAQLAAVSTILTHSKKAADPAGYQLSRRSLSVPSHLTFEWCYKKTESVCPHIANVFMRMKHWFHLI